MSLDEPAFTGPSHAGRLVVDRSGLILEVDERAASHLGIRKVDLLHVPVSRVIHPDDQSAFALCNPMTFSKVAPIETGCRLLTGDGQVLFSHWKIAMHDDGSGDIRAHCTFAAMPQGKSFERNQPSQGVDLLSGETSLRSVLDSIPYQIAVLSQNGVITAVNRRWQDMDKGHGFLGEAVPFLPRVGTDYLAQCQAAPEEDRQFALAAAAGIRAVLNHGLPAFDMEYPARVLNEEHLFRMTVTPMLPPAKGAVVAHQDITEQRRSEEAQQHIQAQLEQAQKMESLGALAGGIAHDINNVLGAIVGLADVHMASEIALSTLPKDLSIIRDSGLRGRDMVQRLLRFARQQGVAQEQEWDLNQVVLDEVALLERTTLQKIKWKVEVEPTPCWIRGDESAISQAVMNLCVNAIQAMPQGGTLSLRTQKRGTTHIQLEVADTGIGMSEDIRARAFDPFFTTKPVGEGTGLGLSVVYGIVQGHGGTLDLASEPGRGTTITLTLPASEHEDIVEPGHLAAPLDLPRKHVLVVDDDDLVRPTLETMLEACGQIPRSAASGTGALAVLRSGYRPDLVILDVNMPDMDGLQVLEWIREQFPQLPVLIASGRMEERVQSVVQSCPPVAVLSKPFTLAEFKKHLAVLGGA